MKKNVFYHLPKIGDSLARFKRTFNKIKTSGLLDKIDNLFVSIDSSEFLNLAEMSPKIQINYCPNQKFNTEAPTINFLREYSLSHDGCSLYLHSKGCSRGKQVGKKIQDWIDMMEYFLIENHEECFNKLKEYATCGCNLVKKPLNKNSTKETFHYSGNFWWANNDYLKTLTPLNINGHKLNSEFWIGAGKKGNPFCLHNSKTNHYSEFYNPNKYRAELAI